MEVAMTNAILTKLREFRNENNERWEENEQCGKKNNEKLQEINKRIDDTNL